MTTSHSKPDLNGASPVAAAAVTLTIRDPLFYRNQTQNLKALKDNHKQYNVKAVSITKTGMHCNRP